MAVCALEKRFVCFWVCRCFTYDLHTEFSCPCICMYFRRVFVLSQDRKFTRVRVELNRVVVWLVVVVVRELVCGIISTRAHTFTMGVTSTAA